jgi:hypothetical protein
MADNYFIFRTAKLKTHQDVTNVLKEQHRAEDYESHRADATQSYKNEYSSNYENAIQKFDELLPKQRRKNAVVGLNFVVTTSEEFSSKAEESAFYGQAINYISQNFGRVVGWAIHRDETSPHLQCVTIPLVDGKLNARQLIGGDKHRMKRIQTDFYETVGKEFGLKRGKDVAETKAVHKTVEQKHREQEKELEQREKTLQERENSLVEREKQLESDLSSLNEKRAIINESVQFCKENSMGVFKELEQNEKDAFFFPHNPREFLGRIKKALTGAWELVRNLSNKNQKLEEENSQLRRQNQIWREETTPEQFREIADTLEKNHCRTLKQFKVLQKRLNQNQEIGY